MTAVALLAFAGACSTVHDLNPAAAKSGVGYADLFTDPKTNVWWKVDVFDARDQGYKEFTQQFNSPGEGIFRVEAKPGRHKARISFVNQAVEAPAEVEAEIREGMITPIRVTLRKGGTANVQIKEDRLSIRRSKVTDYQQEVWQISAEALPPTPYVSKEKTTYWK